MNDSPGGWQAPLLAYAEKDCKAKVIAKAKKELKVLEEKVDFLKKFISAMSEP